MVSFQPRKYKYRTSIISTGPKSGKISSENNAEINIALPENLGGPGGSWSPDELFVSSAEACAMLTFFWLLKDSKANIVSYESSTEGISQIGNGGEFRFTDILIRPMITISKKEDMLDVKGAIADLEDWCCVSNSTKAHVKIEAEIIVAEGD